jgi:hypothetical protein
MPATQPVTGQRVEVTSSGIMLSLVVPQRHYPRDALARVTVQLQNVSQQIVTVAEPCTSDNPVVQVTNGRHVVYPPLLALPGGVRPSCNAPAPPTPLYLQPGGVVKGPHFVIVRAPNLRAVVTLLVNGVEAHVSTPTVVLGLDALRRPQVTLSTAPTVLADIRPAAAPQGVMRWVDWSRCPADGGPQIGQRLTAWNTGGSPLTPPCPRPLEWHVIAGWPNQSVAHINYVSH